MEKNTRIDLITLDEKLKNCLDNYKLNTKIYNRICEGLKIIGNFEDKTFVELYEINKEKGIITGAISDIDGNIFLINLLSSNKNNYTIIKVVSNINEKEYDLSLIKKSNLSKDNIELCRNGQLYDHKFGRLITDNKSFYSIFFPNNICYQIKTNSNNKLNIKSLLLTINSFEKQPNLKELIESIKSLFEEYSIEVHGFLIFKDSACLGDFSYKENQKTNKKELIK